MFVSMESIRGWIAGASLADEDPYYKFEFKPRQNDPVATCPPISFQQTYQLGALAQEKTAFVLLRMLRSKWAQKTIL